MSIIYAEGEPEEVRKEFSDINIVNVESLNRNSFNLEMDKENAIKLVNSIPR